MKVVILSNGKLEVKEIENTLEDLQKIVGGYIEIPLISMIFRDNIIDTIINEEGKYIEELEPSITLINGKTKQIIDVIRGNCIFASHDEEGNTIGLNDKQIKIIMEELKMEVNLKYPNNDKEFKTKLLFI